MVQTEGPGVPQTVVLTQRRQAVTLRRAPGAVWKKEHKLEDLRKLVRSSRARSWLKLFAGT